MVIYFLGVRTDRHGFGILTWKHVGTQKISTQSSKLVVGCRLLYCRIIILHPLGVPREAYMGLSRAPTLLLPHHAREDVLQVRQQDGPCLARGGCGGTGGGCVHGRGGGGAGG